MVPTSSGVVCLTSWEKTQNRLYSKQLEERVKVAVWCTGNFSSATIASPLRVYLGCDLKQKINIVNLCRCLPKNTPKNKSVASRACWKVLETVGRYEKLLETVKSVAWRASAMGTDCYCKKTAPASLRATPNASLQATSRNHTLLTLWTLTLGNTDFITLGNTANIVLIIITWLSHLGFGSGVGVILLTPLLDSAI